jgi:hypothetical protein
MAASVFFLVALVAAEPASASCTAALPSLREASESEAAGVLHDFRLGLLTLREAQAVIEALPASDPVESAEKQAASCWLREFTS